jgi:hypothetical protein
VPAATRGVRVLLDGDSYDEWIVGATNPEEVIANLDLGSPTSDDR